MTPTEILSRAADLLEARKYPKGEILQALEDVCPRDQWESMLAAAYERIDAAGLHRWARHPERTLPQVLAMLRGQDWRSA